MANISVDTDILKESGNNILKLTKEYDYFINEIFSKLEKINDDHIWSGNSASVFVEKVKKDRKDFVELGKSFSEYGKNIVDLSNDLDGLISSE